MDHFADEDTRALSLHAERYPGGFLCGFRRGLLMPAIERAIEAAGTDPIGVVLGSGFEDRPRLIATIAARWRLFGCGPSAVAAVKHPEDFARALDALGVPHPRVSRSVETAGDWLIRRRGASGGGHIRPAAPGPVPPHHFAQQRMPGTPVSALVLAHRTGGSVVAFSRQWADPAPDQPYRFGGLTGPVTLAPALEVKIRVATDRISAHFGLAGLVSLDMLIEGGDWWLTEINPRPGASLDALDLTNPPLLAAHIAACNGERLNLAPSNATIRATAVVYAPATCCLPPVVCWPDYVLDRPPGSARFQAGEPVATVIAEAASAEDAERLVRERAREITGKLEEAADD